MTPKYTCKKRNAGGHFCTLEEHHDGPHECTCALQWADKGER